MGLLALLVKAPKEFVAFHRFGFDVFYSVSLPDFAQKEHMFSRLMTIFIQLRHFHEARILNSLIH